MVLRYFIKVHSILFNRGDDSTELADQFFVELAWHMSLVGSDFREQGIVILASNYAAIFDYSSTPDARASDFAFETLDIILHHSNDAASLEVIMPSVYLSLAFLCSMGRVPEKIAHISPYVCWGPIANVLNKLIQLDKSKEHDVQPPGSPQHLEEDNFIRGLSWSSIYYSQKDFDEGVECLSATVLRIKRCLWLGKELATVSLFLIPLCLLDY